MLTYPHFETNRFCELRPHVILRAALKDTPYATLHWKCGRGSAYVDFTDRNKAHNLNAILKDTYHNYCADSISIEALPNEEFRVCIRSVTSLLPAYSEFSEDGDIQEHADAFFSGGNMPFTISKALARMDTNYQPTSNCSASCVSRVNNSFTVIDGNSRTTLHPTTANWIASYHRFYDKITCLRSKKLSELVTFAPNDLSDLQKISLVVDDLYEFYPWNSKLVLEIVEAYEKHGEQTKAVEILEQFAAYHKDFSYCDTKIYIAFIDKLEAYKLYNILLEACEFITDDKYIILGSYAKHDLHLRFANFFFANCNNPAFDSTPKEMLTQALQLCEKTMPTDDSQWLKRRILATLATVDYSPPMSTDECISKADAYNPTELLVAMAELVREQRLKIDKLLAEKDGQQTETRPSLAFFK